MGDDHDIDYGHTHGHGHDHHEVVDSGEYETHIHDLPHAHPVESEPELCYRSKAGIKGGSYVECDELNSYYYGKGKGGKKYGKKGGYYMPLVQEEEDDVMMGHSYDYGHGYGYTGHGLDLYGHGIGEHGLNLYEDHGYLSSGHDHGHDHGVVHTGEYETHIHDLEHSHPAEAEPEPELCYRSKAGIKRGMYVECGELDSYYYGKAGK